MKFRWWSMYLLSCTLGYALGGVLLLFGQRFRRPVGALVRETAIQHANEAAVKQGPYLAPVAFVASLVAMTVLGVVLIRTLS